VTTSTTDLLNGAIEDDFLRCVQTVPVTVPQLSIIAKAPGVDVTVFIKQCSVLFTTWKVNNTTVGCRKNNQLWLSNLSGFSDNAKLSVSVLAESVESTVLVEDHCELWATLNLHNILQTLDLLG
jgi:hypothetical protein